MNTKAVKDVCTCSFFLWKIMTYCREWQRMDRLIAKKSVTHKSACSASGQIEWRESGLIITNRTELVHKMIWGNMIRVRVKYRRVKYRRACQAYPSRCLQMEWKRACTRHTTMYKHMYADTSVHALATWKKDKKGRQAESQMWRHLLDNHSQSSFCL